MSSDHLLKEVPSFVEAPLSLQPSPSWRIEEFLISRMEWKGWFRRAANECGGVAVGLIVMDEDSEARKGLPVRGLYRA